MKCNHIKQNNEQCEANAMEDSTYCFWHNPNISDEERKEAQAKGGKANKLVLTEQLPLIIVQKPEDVIDLLADTINRVRSGEMDTKLANCLGILASTLIKAFDVVQIETRIEVIEKTISEKRISHGNN